MFTVRALVLLSTLVLLGGCSFFASVGLSRSGRVDDGFPDDAYPNVEGDGDGLRASIREVTAAQFGEPVDAILDVSVRGDWVHREFPDTRRRYRALSATVLFADGERADGRCRYTTFNFMQREVAAGRFGGTEFHSFCTGCLEGYQTCPNPAP